ncbi:hypothetical protein EB118_02220 [bacterium]|nr:hypothetical protein [bacterium]NDC93927.1 hypothetical protein [bacterium]NDD83240.1 hypothetical protein [bacterium]NDG28904.1 hypothetical protein [bacterium]
MDYYPPPPPYYGPPKQDNTMIIVLAVLFCLSISIAVYFLLSQSTTNTTSTVTLSNAEIAEKQKAAQIAQEQAAANLQKYIPPPPDMNWSGKLISNNGRCGPNEGDKSCTGMKCCNLYGVCGGFKGNKDYYCYETAGFHGLYDGREP